jgi:hypothetical protein
VTILITLLLAVPAMSVELFRYRGAAKDGGTLEYVFEAGEQNSPNAITKEKAAEIAADFVTTFYGADESPHKTTALWQLIICALTSKAKHLPRRRSESYLSFLRGASLPPGSRGSCRC